MLTRNLTTKSSPSVEGSVVFCLEALEISRAESQRKLAMETRGAVAAGLYDFLPRPPFVFSRRAANYVRHYMYG